MADAGAVPSEQQSPRILVTGFSAFPGAPVNPSEILVRRLEEKRLAFPGAASANYAVLPVEYQRLPALLTELGRHSRPDIAIHFGLAQGARGFRLEALARNQISEKADNAGIRPGTSRICDGPDELASSLPLVAIAEALQAAGLPIEHSRDAGTYLCNYLSYMALSHSVPDFQPAMSGFIHVPLTAELSAGVPATPSKDQARETTLDNDQLLGGALLIIESCCREWRKRRASLTPGEIAEV